MTLYAGNTLDIQIGNGSNPEVFTSIGGLRNLRMNVQNQALANDDITSGSWRKNAANSGFQQCEISGDGLFSDSTAENNLRTQVFEQNVQNYRLIFGNGDILNGGFIITRYERLGDRVEAEQYRMTLTSAGTISYTTA